MNTLYLLARRYLHIGLCCCIAGLAIVVFLPLSAAATAAWAGFALAQMACERRAAMILGFARQASLIVDDLCTAMNAQFGSDESRRGPIIGMFDGIAIHAWVDVPERGGRLEYVGAAPRDAGGGIRADRLGSNEVLLFPGLIYRKAEVVTA